MNDRLLDVELVADQVSLARLSETIRSQGRLLVCHRCRDIEGVIAGVLIVQQYDEAWALCGPCLRQAPLEGQVAS